MATDAAKPALLFSSAIEIYNANKAFSNIDTSTITGIPTNPVTENLLSPLGTDNIYAKNLSDTFSALELDKNQLLRVIIMQSIKSVLKQIRKQV